MNTTPARYSVAEAAFLKKKLESLNDKIAVRAYLKAEKRDFLPGDAWEDWLAAQAELLREEVMAHGSAGE